MSRYGRDYDGRNFVERAGDSVRRWFGGDEGRYDAPYRGRGWSDYDRDFGWRGGPRAYEPEGAEWSRRYGRPAPGYRRPESYYRTEGPGRPGYRYAADYRFHAERDRYGRPPGREPNRARGWDRPFREMGGDYDYDRGIAYGDYGARPELFRSARGGGVAPGRYFRGYGIGSGGSYEPY